MKPNFLIIGAMKCDTTSLSAYLIQKNAQEAFPLYAVMDIAVVPSLFEGFGLSAAEAMAAGCPIVASDTDGLREVVAHGYLFPPKNSKAIARYLTDLLSDPEQANTMEKSGPEASHAIFFNFSMERFAMSMISAYNSLKA